MISGRAIITPVSIHNPYKEILAIFFVLEVDWSLLRCENIFDTKTDRITLNAVAQ